MTVGVIVPYMIDPGYGNLGSKVFFIWGGLCACSIFWAYFFVPETRGLTLEQVDKMMGEFAYSDIHCYSPWNTWLTCSLHQTEEVTARKSATWKPHDNFTRATARKSELIEPTMSEKNVEWAGRKREDGDAMMFLAFNPLESFISLGLAAFWLTKQSHLCIS
jgi:hypothetical protein